MRGVVRWCVEELGNIHTLLSKRSYDCHWDLSVCWCTVFETVAL